MTNFLQNLYPDLTGVKPWQSILIGASQVGDPVLIVLAGAQAHSFEAGFGGLDLPQEVKH